MQQSKHLDELRKDKQNQNKKTEKKEQGNKTEKVEITTNEPNIQEAQAVDESKTLSKDETIHKLRLHLQTLMTQFVAVSKFVQTFRNIGQECGAEMISMARSEPNILAIDVKQFDANFVMEQLKALGPEMTTQFSLGPPGQNPNQPPQN